LTSAIWDGGNGDSSAADELCERYRYQQVVVTDLEDEKYKVRMQQSSVDGGGRRGREGNVSGEGKGREGKGTERNLEAVM
jgi:hypothetical protein